MDLLYTAVQRVHRVLLGLAPGVPGVPGARELASTGPQGLPGGVPFVGEAAIAEEAMQQGLAATHLVAD